MADQSSIDYKFWKDKNLPLLFTSLEEVSGTESDGIKILPRSIFIDDFQMKSLPLPVGNSYKTIFPFFLKTDFINEK